MAAASGHMTAHRAVHSHRAALDAQPARSCRAAAPSGARFGASSLLSATLCAARGERWKQNPRTTSSVKFVASALMEEAVSASQAESGDDSLSMYFKAEGSLSENAVSKVTKVLEGTEGVGKVKVYIDEGAATVEFVKQTNIQATGVASSLVEIIEQAGFRMQALSLGFDDDDGEDDDYIDYDASTYTEEEATEE